MKLSVKMVRVISQETFDAVVKENMEEFEMSREEAIKEAIEQFQTQVKRYFFSCWSMINTWKLLLEITGDRLIIYKSKSYSLFSQL